MQLRKEKILYCLCDEKFSFNGKCPNKQLYVLQLGDDDADQTECNAQEEIEIKLQHSNDYHLSLNALKASLGVRTTKFSLTSSMPS